MKPASFDEVLEALSSKLCITQIMVADPQCCAKEDDPLNILEIMKLKNYDIMPINEEGKVTSYVERELLEKEKQIEPAVRQITTDVIVSADTCVSEMVDLFQRSRFFFVNKRNDLVGLVTYADLNKIPMRVLLFVLISQFEFLLLTLIKKFYRKETWISKLALERQEKIKELYNEKRKHDTDISFEDCLNLGDMIELLECDSELRVFVGYASLSSCKKECGYLDILRNNVMHPSNSLIKNYIGVKKLSSRIRRLHKSIERIRSILVSMQT